MLAEEMDLLAAFQRRHGLEPEAFSLSALLRPASAKDLRALALGLVNVLEREKAKIRKAGHLPPRVYPIDAICPDMAGEADAVMPRLRPSA